MAAKGMSAVLEASRLVIDVSELLLEPGHTKPLRMVEEMSGLQVDMARVGTDPVTFDLVLHALAEGILVTGTLSGTEHIECSRCLTEADMPFSEDVDELFLTGVSADEDAYRVVGDHIDLEPMVRDVVVLDLPLNPLCRPDCKGLCPQCGTNRNETDCGHTAERIDARWEPLRRLKETMGE